ncbi:hypothetical protein BGX31_004037 [Mortierella sp. GBA43]|nr:hypothetical protein BGX31_004037 [Mortierella sp. GBA43]
MTEFKMSNESLYQDLLVNDLRHDGILRVDKCNMDVMIMEAKPTKVGARDDFGKAWGETRLEGGHPVLHEVDRFIIPLVKILQRFVAFKRRIDATVKLLLQHHKLDTRGHPRK